MWYWYSFVKKKQRNWLKQKLKQNKSHRKISNLTNTMSGLRKIWNETNQRSVGIRLQEHIRYIKN